MRSSGLADAGRADDQGLHAAVLGETFVGADDLHPNAFLPRAARHLVRKSASRRFVWDGGTCMV